MPISLRFDTAGPVAKCARDVALLLDVLADSTKGQVPNGGYTSSLLGETAWKNIKVGTVDPDLWLHSDALIGYRDGQKEQIVCVNHIALLRNQKLIYLGSGSHGSI